MSGAGANPLLAENMAPNYSYFWESRTMAGEITLVFSEDSYYNTPKSEFRDPARFWGGYGTTNSNTQRYGGSV